MGSNVDNNLHWTRRRIGDNQPLSIFHGHLNTAAFFSFSPFLVKQTETWSKKQMPNSKMSRKMMLSLFALLIIFVAGFAYVASTIIPSGTPESVQTVFGSGNYVWQSLYVYNVDGSNYWANAPKPISVASIFGSNADEFKEVQTLQNNIYMNLNTSGVTAWTFSCIETITLKSKDGVTIDTITTQTINPPAGQTAVVGQNLWITGASVSSAELQTVLNQPAGEYYFIITLSNINLTVTTEGLGGVHYTKNLSASSGTSQNVLQWLIKIT
jgi:hypothetical protein